MKKSFGHSIRTALFTILLATGLNASAQILTNGDFEAGDSGNGFFVHDYTVINPVTGTSTPGLYARTTNPALMNSTYIAQGDHTTGTGNMLVFDGSTLANRFFWTTGNTGGAIGGFTAGTTYTFSFWIRSVSNEVTSDDATRASIGLFFVNANNINPANQNFLAPLPDEGWVHIQYSFVATADNVMVRLKTNNPGPIGNDFAVDDFSITEGGLDLEGSYTFSHPTCPDSNDGTVTVSLVGGMLPYSAYTLTGSASQTNNTGVFTGLDEGTYNISVTDAAGTPYTQTGIVLAAPNPLVVGAPANICPGGTAALSASGGTGSYTWTASPPDASITNPNAASQTVSPLVTTTYTVTSGSLSSPVNLIENGDFSQGDALFTTQYMYVADPNPFGVQAAYSVVTNPAAWFTAFVSCGDHTTGAGNMIVYDGSTDPTGNVIVWANQNPIAVLPNTDYTFSYYVASVSPENPARLEVKINGVSQGDPVLAPGATCFWTQVSYNWNSGANTTANVALFNFNSASGGNDFALDDIAFKETVTCLYQETVTVTVSGGTVPTFNAVGAICSGDALNPLPTTSLNGVTGTWSPALDNTATTTYTFTPTAGQCASTATLTITVNPSTVPAFTAIAPICAGAVLGPLPTTSNNGIAGTWSPAPNNNATTTYTFTPNAGQCATTATLVITVNTNNTAPTFTAIAPICAGSVLTPLPTTSNNGIAGTWSPALNNNATTTYTFTPNAGQCATTATLVITVNPSNTVPIFTAIAPICAGAVLSPLSTTSNNGITGTWSPAPNNNATTTYTFTPYGGQCATPTTLTIVVNPSTLPTFAPIAAICAGEDLDPLPTTSNNGIVGTWSPAPNNNATTTYTFTPNAGQCATAATLTIAVNGAIDFTIAEGCNGVNYTLTAVLEGTSGALYAWFDPSGAPIGSAASVVIASPGIYELVVTQNGCSQRKTINVTTVSCTIQKGISPNNDGLNDYFDLEGFNVAQLHIYNRYGTAVYAQANYQNQWYGQTDNGDELPDGTYYYVIDFTDLNPKTGWIYLHKQQ
ncbi:T9SS type B sorting domain-containing protein [Flavobacterium caeni]|uniref:Gliding motility-associated C-terminal domain-containing protein n=1 Tax=Flavobacterium caeni TaxID=490189 RepID=A0A1G5B7I3_9FLAO|nr:gliding motility-associated C-terminal domain-containing protein [Flavobacterium caeni]SCX86103.1 gliding motility-associated C-terminal domain-containing protein [Flavobacterium caeni]